MFQLDLEEQTIVHNWLILNGWKTDSKPGDRPPQFWHCDHLPKNQYCVPASRDLAMTQQMDWEVKQVHKGFVCEGIKP